MDSDQAAVDAAVARARETFESGVWRKLPAAHRADVLFRAAAIIKERTEELAELEAHDNGMNTTAAKHIISVANGILTYYAGWVGKRSTASRAMWCPTAFSAGTRTNTTSLSSSRLASSA